MRSTLLLLVLTLSPLAAQETSPSSERTEPVPASPADKYRIDGSALCFQHIRDKAEFPWFVKNRELGSEFATSLHLEEFAYDTVLIHAAQFPHGELEEHARRDVLFGNLLEETRNDYKLELVHFKGRLRRLQKAKVTEGLKLQGVENVYEAWIFPVGESTPICVHLSQLPDGLEPQKDLAQEVLNRPVAVSGYFFKLLKYEQQSFDRANPGKHKVWAAPVLIGRSLTLLADTDIVDAGLAWRMKFIPIAIGGFTVLALAMAWLSWRYRRGDRHETERQREKRNQNPFENV